MKALRLGKYKYRWARTKRWLRLHWLWVVYYWSRVPVGRYRIDAVVELNNKYRDQVLLEDIAFLYAVLQSKYDTETAVQSMYHTGLSARRAALVILGLGYR